MDIGTLVAVLMLVGWSIWTFAFNAPGWAHSFLILGIFLLIYRIVVRGTPGYRSGRR
jgi:hypothetical protein